MEFFCTEEFKDEFLKLLKKKSYSDLDKEFHKYLFANNNQFTGTRLNGGAYPPMIKKRISGSGGYRLYYVWYVKDNKLYFMWVHPKTGSDGKQNIDKDLLKELANKLYEDIKNNNLFEVKENNSKDGVNFSKVKTLKTAN